MSDYKTQILPLLLRALGRRKSDKFIVGVVVLLIIEQIVNYLQLIPHPVG
jgi:hypothetical protein